MSITLNEKQCQAVEMAQQAAKDRNCVAVLSGAAGTGKTTTLKTICEELPHSTIVAPTGRASLRVQELTGETASTIHKWLYSPLIDQKTGAILGWVKKDSSQIAVPESGLLIIDESSMINEFIWGDISKLAEDAGFSILLVGDPFQLPPVSTDDEEPFSVFGSMFEKTDAVELTEVRRQALDSSVLRAATAVRQASSWAEARDALSEFVVDSERSIKDATKLLCSLARDSHDVSMISYTNAVRHDANRKARLNSLIDPDGDPLSGEPILVRKNNPTAGVMNGQIVDFGGFDREFTVKGHRFGVAAINGMYCALSSSELLGGKAPPYELVCNRVSKEPYISANLGYCLTCHAAQGSDWDDIIILFERKLLTVMDWEMRIRWIYTALTRARKNAYIFTVNN